MAKKIIRIQGGLEERTSPSVSDDTLAVATNVYYNKEGYLQTRRGYRTFGDDLGASPTTSYFFWQREDNKNRYAVCHNGTSVYSYVEGSDTWSSLYTHNQEFETIPGLTSYRTRRDHVVYKNICYMQDGVSVYQKYNGTTHALIGAGGSGTVTADHTTDRFTKVAHGYPANYEIYITTSGTMPAGIVEYQVYYIIVVSADIFQLASSVDGTAVTFTSNGTGTLTTYDLTERRFRYMEYLNNRCFSAGNDAAPSTFYYTGAAPTDLLTDLNLSSVVVGADEIGKINGIAEYGDNILIIGENKCYTFDNPNSGTPTVEKIDVMGGGYGNRMIHHINNTLVYQSDRGIDVMTRRDGVSGSSALQGASISDNIMRTMESIDKNVKRFTTGFYNKRLGRFFVAVDTNVDGIPDTFFEWNAKMGNWVKISYAITSIYDFGIYITTEGYEKQILACGDGRCYEYDYGWDDNGTAITASIQTKTFVFADEFQFKELEYVEVSGYVESGGTLTVGYNMDNSVFSDTASITASSGESKSLATSENYDDGTANKTLYRFIKRLPVYREGQNVYITLSATCQYIIEGIGLSVSGKTIDLFPYSNIL